jgi:hypothetical protein
MHSYRVSKLKRGPGYCRIMDRRWITARVLLWVVPRALPGRLVSTTGTAVVRATIGDTSFPRAKLRDRRQQHDPERDSDHRRVYEFLRRIL